VASIDPNAAAAGDGLFGLPDRPEDAGVIIVPVPFDATTSYRPGTAGGPEAIRVASHQVDLYDRHLGNPWKAGIAMAEAIGEIATLNDEARPLVEALADDADADREAINERCQRCNELVEAEVGRWIEAGKLVGTVGGDHATAFGSIKAHAARHGPFGILHVDAHADLRRDYQGLHWSHASVMEAVTRLIPEVECLVQVGVRDFCEEELDRVRASEGRIRTWFDDDLAVQRFESGAWSGQVRNMVDSLPERVYLSFDIDGLDPKLCPNTGTPVPGGLSFQQAVYLIGAVAQSGRRLVGFDLVEVAPGRDGDEWDGNVGARLLYKIIGWALKSRGEDFT